MANPFIHREGGSPAGNLSSQTTLLARLPFQGARHGGLNTLQSQVDSLVTHFVEEAASPTTLAALTAGGLAYRYGKIGIMGLDGGTIGRAPLRVASIAFGLGSEVTAFEFTQRLLHTFWATGQSPLQSASPVTRHLSPNLWSWSGPGGWKQSLINDLVTFGMLKGAGYLSRESNLIFQHTFSSTAMVGGHQAAAFLDVTLRPEGSLAEQLLHAEVTNLQLGAGVGLVHAVAPGVLALERGLDFSMESRIGALREPPLHSRWNPFLRPLVEGVLGDRAKNHLILMSSNGEEGGGLSGKQILSITSVESKTLSDPQPKDQDELLQWLGVSERGDRVALGNTKPSWQSHLQTNKENILKAASEIKKEGRGNPDPWKRPGVRILGAGTASDVPLEELAREFRVILVDLDAKALQSASEKLPQALRSYVSTEVRDVTGGWVFEFARRARAIVEDPALPLPRKFRHAVEALRELNTQMSPPDLEGLIAADLIVSTMLVSQFLEFHSGIFLKHFYSPKVSPYWAEEFVRAQKEFAGRAAQTHVQALIDYARKGRGVAYLSSDVHQLQTDPKDFSEREIPVLFDPQGETIRHLREIEKDFSGIQVRESTPWRWDFAKLGEEPRQAALNKKLPQALRNLVIAWKEVESMVLSPEISPIEKMNQLRDQIRPTRRFSREEAAQMIPQILALSNSVPVFEKYEALVALGEHKDFDDYSALIFALERLAKEEKPISLDPVLREEERTRELMSEEGSFAAPEPKISGDLDSPLLEAFAYRYILENVVHAEEKTSILPPRPKNESPGKSEAHSIMLVTSLGALASHHDLKGEENFHRILDFIRGYGLDYASVGYALREILKNPNLDDDLSFQKIFEALPPTLEQKGQLSYWTHEVLDKILAHPHFDPNWQIENYLSTVQLLTRSTNFRIAYYESFARHPRLEGKEVFRGLLSAYYREEANPGLTLKAMAPIFRHPQFDDFSLAFQIISLSKAKPEIKVQAWYHVSENPNVGPETLKRLVENLKWSGADPLIVAEHLFALIQDRPLYEPEVLGAIVEAYFHPFSQGEISATFQQKKIRYFELMAGALDRLAKNPAFSQDQMENILMRIQGLYQIDPLEREILLAQLIEDYEKAHRYKN